MSKITNRDLQSFRGQITKMFDGTGVHCALTWHINDRINHKRNGKPITIFELTRIFMKLRLLVDQIKTMKKEHVYVLVDEETNINIPFKVNDVEYSDDLNLVCLSIQRSKHYHVNSDQTELRLRVRKN